MTGARPIVAEGLGTAFLLAIVVGSGIMADRLSGGNVAVALLANSLATGAGLVALILMLGTVSGAHLNPAVTLARAARGHIGTGMAAAYVAAQVTGAVLGVIVAHAMFGEPLLAWSNHARAGGAQALSEGVATFGLLATIDGCGRGRPEFVPFAVAAYITSAYWFTASTSFANPAVTVARALTDTFTGIRPVDVPAFIGAQLVGAAMATLVFAWLLDTPRGKQ